MMRAAWAFLIPIVAIIGGCTVAIVATIARARVREAEIRERIAMIERGLMPSPEVDPAGFDRAIGRRNRLYRRPHDPGKHRRVSIIMMGVGFGVMVMFWMIGESDGPAIGAFMVILGFAFFISSLFPQPPREPWNAPVPPVPPPAPPTTNSSAGLR
jgi:uncharacterized protein DUF6249